LLGKTCLDPERVRGSRARFRARGVGTPVALPSGGRPIHLEGPMRTKLLLIGLVTLFPASALAETTSQRADSTAG